MFYETAKVHKLGKGEGCNELTMRPFYQTAYERPKCLNSLLAALGKLECTLLNTETYINQIKSQAIPDCNQIISFDV